MSEENPKKMTAEEKLEQKDDKSLERIAELKEVLKKPFKINPHEIDKEIIHTISEMHRYNTEIAEARINLTAIKRKKNKVYGELYEKYKFNYNYKLDNKHEIETWIERNPKYQLILTYYEHQITYIKYIEAVVQGLKDKRWAIRDIIENLKIELG